MLYGKEPRYYIDTIENCLNFDCLFPQYTMEYSLPIQYTKDAILNIRDFIIKESLYVNFPLEVRFTARDDILFSTCEGPYDQVWIGVVMYRPYLQDPPQWKSIFAGFEAIMQKFEGARPHWAKAFDKANFNIHRLYPRTADKFLEIRR